MTVEDKIDEMERRVEDLETKLVARVDAVLVAMTGAQALTNDAIVLAALIDREAVDRLLLMRRLAYQKNRQDRVGTAPIEAIMIERMEMALQMADTMVQTPSFKPR